MHLHRSRIFLLYCHIWCTPECNLIWFSCTLLQLYKVKIKPNQSATHYEFGANPISPSSDGADSYLIGADRKCSERFHQSVSLLSQLVSLLGFLLPEWVESKCLSRELMAWQKYYNSSGHPVTHSECRSWLVSCSVPSRETARCSSDADEEGNAQDLQEHSGIIQGWMFHLMVNVTFGSKFIIPGL